MHNQENRALNYDRRPPGALAPSPEPDGGAFVGDDAAADPDASTGAEGADDASATLALAFAGTLTPCESDAEVPAA